MTPAARSLPYPMSGLSRITYNTIQEWKREKMVRSLQEAALQNAQSVAGLGNAGTRFRLLGLPSELRSQIYGYILQPFNDHKWKTATLRTCKTILAEALPFLYGCHAYHEFKLYLVDWSDFHGLSISRLTMAPLRRFHTSCAPQFLRKLTIHFRLAPWSTSPIPPIDGRDFAEATKILPRMLRLEDITVYWYTYDSVL